MKNLKPSDLELTYESDYLTDEFYESLLHDREAISEIGPSTDLSLVNECASLLYQEARLLDGKHYKSWLDLYTRDSIYWIPHNDQADIRSYANLMFDDRRRMEDRVLRLISKYAHSLMPERCFQHVVANVEAWSMPDGRRRVLASQVVYEYRRGHEIDRHVYRTDHTLRLVDGAWKIAVKRCVLINLDASVEPPTLL